MRGGAAHFIKEWAASFMNRPGPVNCTEDRPIALKNKPFYV